MLAVNGAVPLRMMAQRGLWTIWELSDGRFACYREGKAEMWADTPSGALQSCERRMRQIADMLGRTPGGN